MYDDCAASLFAYLARRVGRELAEDLLAETFRAAIESYSKFDSTRGSEKAWLFGIATNLLRRHWRTEPNGPLQAGWFTENIGASLLAGAGVTPAELVEFAQSLKSVRPLAQVQGRPSVDLVSDPLPAGLTVLVGEDVAFTQQVTETSWVATVGGVDGVTGQLTVQTWQGADEQGVYAKHAPIQAQRVTIRGHDGYQFTPPQRSTNGPLEIEIWWTEAPGLVVSVRSTELFELDELMTLIEQMIPVDDVGYNAFIGAPDNS